MTTLNERLQALKVIPAIAINSTEDAAPLGKVLVGNGMCRNLSIMMLLICDINFNLRPLRDINFTMGATCVESTLAMARVISDFFMCPLYHSA